VQPAGIHEIALRGADTAAAIARSRQVGIDETSKKAIRPVAMRAFARVDLLHLAPDAAAVFRDRHLERGDALPGDVDDVLGVVEERDVIVIAAEEQDAAIELHEAVERRSRAEGEVPRLLRDQMRRASFNRMLLRAAQELAPARLQIDIHDIAAVPLYNQDVEDAGTPESVALLRQAIRDGDGLLIGTPEYNHGVPGVLKNTIDWLSRPPRDSVLNMKAAAIMGASPGMGGTARAQTQLRQAFVFTNTFAMLQPEVLVARAREKFDAEGRLTDDGTRAFLAKFLNEFVSWIARVNP
jgi:chromate reductase